MYLQSDALETSVRCTQIVLLLDWFSSSSEGSEDAVFPFSVKPFLFEVVGDKEGDIYRTCQVINKFIARDWLPVPRDCSKLSRGSQNDFIEVKKIIASNANVLTHLISEPEFFFAELHASTKTFCHAEPFIVKLACEFKTNSTEPRTARRVDIDARS
jgi:hypothetical protein